MATNVTFAGVSLQSSNIVTKNISHEDAGHRQVNFQRLGKDGAKVVDDSFDVKTITLEGVAKDSTKALLEARIDGLKKTLMQSTEGDLDIAYSSGTRRYVAICTDFSVTREYYTVGVIDFQITFVVVKPFGKNIDTTTLHFAGVTTGHNDSGYFYGSAKPLPKIKLTVNSATALTGFEFQNKTTGEKVSVSETLVNSDVVIIDCDELKVTKNGVEIDYTGVFPEFQNGWNDFYIWFTATAYNIDLKLIYYQLWV